MQIDSSVLAAVMPNVGERGALFLGPLNAALDRYSIGSAWDTAAFLANAAHESQELGHLRENLNYGADGLLKTWPKHFTPEEAQTYARQPERIGNRAYALRLGNGPETSGDGWHFRGGGIFQLTGRGNFTNYSRARFGDDRLVTSPDLIVTPETACDSAGWFWELHGCNRFAAVEDFDGVCDCVNQGRKTIALGDAIGYRSRADYFTAARAALNV